MYVSNICCIGITAANFETYYFEDSMYDLLNCIKEGKLLDNRFEQLVKYQQDYDSGKIWNDLFGL